MLRATTLLLGATAWTAHADLPDNYPWVPMRSIKNANMRMPLIGIGTWEYNNSVAEGAVAAAFAMGYRHVDTAHSYGNQVGVGKALANSNVPRSEYFITTKIPGGLNATATLATLDQNLKELGVDYVDLLLIHWPGPSQAARVAQWLALESWAKTGKTRAVGISHYCKTHIEEVLAVATLPVALNQNQYHIGMYHDTQPRLHDKDFNEQNGIIYMSYSTLCGPCPPPDDMALINGPLVTPIGKAHGKSGAQVALRWAVQQGIPVVPKSTNPQHLRENFEIFDFYLSDVEMATLNAATSPAETGTPEQPDDAQDCSFE